MGAGEAEVVDRSRINNERQSYADILVVQREIVQLQNEFQEGRDNSDDDCPQKCSDNVATLSIRTALVGFEPQPPKSGQERATIQKRQVDDVVYEIVEDDAAPSELISRQCECAIDLIE